MLFRSHAWHGGVGVAAAGTARASAASTPSTIPRTMAVLYIPVGETALTLQTWLVDTYGMRSLQRVREMRESLPIARGAAVRPLAEAPIDLGGVELVSRTGETITLDQHLETSYTEGLLVLRDGAIVFERYRNGMQPDTLHLLASVTKSLTASVLGIALSRGQLALDDRVGDVAPDLAATCIGDATVRQIADMTAGLGFPEAYDDLSDPTADSPVLRFFRQIGTMPLLPGEAPVGVLGLLPEYPLEYPHGERFEYRTPLTCALGHMVETAAGRPYADLLAELWAGIGAEHDAAIMLDVAGVPFAGGGMLTTLRDLARYGQVLLEDGAGVIPADWVADTRNGSDETRRAFDLDPALTEADLAQWAEYRNQFWIVESGRVFEALGLFGQVCRVNVDTRTVIVRFSAQPNDERDDVGYETYRAHAAIEAALS